MSAVGKNIFILRTQIFLENRCTAHRLPIPLCISRAIRKFAENNKYKKKAQQHKIEMNINEKNQKNNNNTLNIHGARPRVDSCVKNGSLHICGARQITINDPLRKVKRKFVCLIFGNQFFFLLLLLGKENGKYQVLFGNGVTFTFFWNAKPLNKAYFFKKFPFKNQLQC
jgi:hypothetical protein